MQNIGGGYVKPLDCDEIQFLYKDNSWSTFLIIKLKTQLRTLYTDAAGENHEMYIKQKPRDFILASIHF